MGQSTPDNALMPLISRQNYFRLGNLTVASLLVATAALGEPPEAGLNRNPGTPWPAADALGRVLPGAQETGGSRSNRCVGIFYFLTHELTGPDLPNDLSRILPQDPDILQKPNSPMWGSGDYYWGEPLYGYYNSKDPWVLRRHARLLSDAGVDTVIFDTTNRRTYRDVYMEICKIWMAIRREGGRTPQICFMVNTEAGATAQEIYQDLYQPGLYRDLWFLWQGKPLLICDPAEASPEVAKFFTLRKAHWPFELVNTHNEWHWESAFPQVYSYDVDSGKPEQVNVAVAQNLRAADGKVTNMSEGNARGRSFHDGKQSISPGSVNYGYNFAEQWQRALQLDPPFVMVTGWNEWTAGKFSRPGLPVVFVDQYDEEFSRDIEPVTGLHNDNYYYELVANVRRYKGALPVPAASAPETINVSGDFSQWRAVAPAYTVEAPDREPRDFGSGALHYQNASARNELTLMKVARDEANLYFYARTISPLTPATSTNWMWLLIDVDQNPHTGWAGFDYIVNRQADAEGKFWLEKNVGGWNWQKVAPTTWRAMGNELQVSIPRRALGLKSGETKTAIDFKWADNLQHPGEVMDFYLSGDVAPEGRFSYRYNGD
jgi:hypothetical protein